MPIKGWVGFLETNCGTVSGQRPGLTLGMRTINSLCHLCFVCLFLFCFLSDPSRESGPFSQGGLAKESEVENSSPGTVQACRVSNLPVPKTQVLLQSFKSPTLQAEGCFRPYKRISLRHLAPRFLPWPQTLPTFSLKAVTWLWRGKSGLELFTNPLSP